MGYVLNNLSDARTVGVEGNIRYYLHVYSTKRRLTGLYSKFGPSPRARNPLSTRSAQPHLTSIGLGRVAPARARRENTPAISCYLFFLLLSVLHACRDQV